MDFQFQKEKCSPIIKQIYPDIFSWISFQNLKEIKYFEENSELNSELDYDEQLKSQLLGQNINKQKNFPTLNQVVDNIRARIHKFGDIQRLNTHLFDQEQNTTKSEQDNSYDKGDPFINDDQVNQEIPYIPIEASYKDYQCFSSEQMYENYQEFLGQRLQLQQRMNSEISQQTEPQFIQKEKITNTKNQKNKKIKKL